MEQLLLNLEEFFSFSKPPFIQSDYWDRKNERKITNEHGVHSLEEIMECNLSKLQEPNEFIKPEFFNKKTTIGNFTLHVQMGEETEHNKNVDGSYSSLGYKREYINYSRTINVIVEYHGLFIELGQYNYRISKEIDNYLPTQTNIHWLTFTKKTPYSPREEKHRVSFHYYEYIKDIFDLISEHWVWTDCDLDFQESSYPSKRKFKTLKQYTEERIDVKWFVEKDINKGIYRPDVATIKQVFDIIERVPNKDILKELGVTTIQLSGTAHFFVQKIFNINGINVKGPKAVLEKYDLIKYAENKELAGQIKEEARLKKVKEKLRIEQNKFTLMQKGKVILNHKDRYDIIEFLENYLVKDLDDEITSLVKPVFDNNKQLEKIYIGSWGTYYEYESSGQKKSFDYEVYDDNLAIIDNETLDNIYRLFSDELMPDISDKELEIRFDWPEYGFNLLGVQKGKRGKLSLFVEKKDE